MKRGVVTESAPTTGEAPIIQQGVNMAEIAQSLPGECSRREAFRRLVEQVQACRLCPRMEGRARVFGVANGDPCAVILFIAEAPGRHGADRWEIPLFGDQTGRNFETLLSAAGLDRASVFVMNAVLF